MVLLLSSRFLLVACVALAGAEVALDITNFDEVVGTTPWVIEFASDMCMSCKEFAPTWHAFAAKVEGIEGLGVGRVNIDKKVGLQLAQRTPTVLSKIPKVIFMPAPATSKEYVTLDGTSVPALLLQLAQHFPFNPSEL